MRSARLASRPSDNIAVAYVDTSAIVENYRFLRARCPGECGATVKADAYGLGADQIVKALRSEGCRHFFVATLSEALALRARFGDVEISVFSGLGANEEQEFLTNKLRPILNSIDQVRRWHAVAHVGGDLHVDTGMNRLGLDTCELEQLTRYCKTHGDWRAELVLTHLAFADEPERSENKVQIDRFRSAVALLPPCRTSIGNSAGVLNGSEFAGDVARPGIGIYGGNPWSDRPNPMISAVRLCAPLIQVRNLQAGQTVGYGGDFRAQRAMTIGTVAIGYADGIPRNLAAGAFFRIEGRPCPVIGRISMDSTMIDLSAVEAALHRPGVEVEVFGETPIDQFAKWAGSISYEILCGLGHRISRRYV